MMGQRQQLQTELEAIDGVKRVYYQPPETVKLDYPCIIYDLSKERVAFADNVTYKTKKSYTVTVIDRNPDSLIPDAVRDSFMYCTFNRTFSTSGLHHFVYELYY